MNYLIDLVFKSLQILLMQKNYLQVCQFSQYCWFYFLAMSSLFSFPLLFFFQANAVHIVQFFCLLLWLTEEFKSGIMFPPCKLIRPLSSSFFIYTCFIFLGVLFGMESLTICLNVVIFVLSSVISILHRIKMIQKYDWIFCSLIMTVVLFAIFSSVIKHHLDAVVRVPFALRITLINILSSSFKFLSIAYFVCLTTWGINLCQSNALETTKPRLPCSYCPELSLPCACDDGNSIHFI